MRPSSALRLISPPAKADAPAVGAFVIAVALHVVVGAALLAIDFWRTATPTRSEEIPVEVVEAPPTPQPPPEPKSEPETASSPAAAQPQPQTPPLPAGATSPASPPPDPTAPELSPSRTASRAPAASAPAPSPAASAPPPPGQSSTEAIGLRPPPPAPVAEPAQAPAARRADEPRAITAEFALAPESFHRAAAPAASRETNDEYKGLVFQRLERAKIVPPGIRAPAVAILGLTLDQGGNLVTAALLRSTGDATLDAEALALVRRAAPFPKPPPGVSLNFSPAIVFGVN